MACTDVLYTGVLFLLELILAAAYLAFCLFVPMVWQPVVAV
jgi:hypothetical protein